MKDAGSDFGGWKAMTRRQISTKMKLPSDKVVSEK